jgi:hypothetical protein
LSCQPEVYNWNFEITICDFKRVELLRSLTSRIPAIVRPPLAEWPKVPVRSPRNGLLQRRPYYGRSSRDRRSKLSATWTRTGGRRDPAQRFDLQARETRLMVSTARRVLRRRLLSSTEPSTLRQQQTERISYEE